MARSKFPHGFEPIAKGLKDQQIVERLKKLFEATKNVLDEKTASERQGTSESVENLSSYQGLIEHLVSTSLLEKSSPEVSVWLACCVANIFGIFSPHVPLKGVSLKDTLLFMVKQLGGLSHTADNLYPRYLYLLECTSAFSMFDLALELDDDASVILRELIKTGFNAVKESQEDDDRRVQSLIIAQTSQLIERIDQIPNRVIDAIFYFLVAPQKFVNRESYRMARELIIKNQATLEPYFQMAQLPDCNLITEKSLSSVVFELHEFAPDMVYPILEALHFKMKSEDATIRKEIVKLLGSLFGSQKSRLAEEKPDLWNAYMRRFADISDEVRLACINLSPNILIHHPELRGQVSGLLAARFHDINESIRLESVAVVRKVAFTKFEALNEELLDCLTGRIRDKKVKVRQEAIRASAAIHRFVYVGEQFTESARSSVAVIMQRILNFYYQPYLDYRLLIEKLFVSSFVPYKADPKKRMEILIAVFMKLGDVEIRSFEEIMSQQSRFRRLAREIFQNQSSERKKADDVIRIQIIAESYSSPSKIAVHIQKFLEYVGEVPRLLQLLQYIFGTHYECTKVESALVEVLQRLKNNKQLAEETVSIAIEFLERYAPLQIDVIALEEFLSLVIAMLELETSVGSEENEKRILKYLRMIQIVVDNYTQFLCNEKLLELFEELFKFGSPLIEAAMMKILATVITGFKFETSAVPSQIRDRLDARFKKCAREGDPRAAKYAVRCIAEMHGKEASVEVLKDLVKDSIPLINLANLRSCTAIKAIGSCSAYIPLFLKECFGDSVSENFNKIIFEKYKANSVTQENPDLKAKTSYYKIHYGNKVNDECLLRVFGMRFLCDLLTSLIQAKAEEKYVDRLALKTLETFEVILQKHGKLDSTSCSFDEFAGHMRLMAGFCILKLAKITKFSTVITASQLVLLASLIRDELRFVRLRFLGKLAKHLNSIRLPNEYMGIFSLAPLVKDDEEFHKSAINLLKGCILRRKKFVDKESAECIALSPFHKSEYAVAYGLYILSKQKDFVSACDVSCLREMKDCLWFIISAFISPGENRSIAEITSILEHLKLLGDANLTQCTEEEQLEQNKKLWALADIGLLMLSYRVPPVNKVDFKPQLRKRFFVRNLSVKEKVYLPKKIIEEEEKGAGGRKRKLPMSKVTSKKVKSEKNVQVAKVLSNESGMGFEEEAPSRSPSRSSLEDIVEENQPSTSEDHRVKISPSNNGSAAKFVEQLNGISPIVPQSSIQLERKNIEHGLDKASRYRRNLAFMSSTPIVRNVPQKRLLRSTINANAVVETKVQVLQKKRKVLGRLETREALGKKLDPEEQVSEKTVPKRGSQRSRKPQISAKVSSSSMLASEKQSQSPKKKKRKCNDTAAAQSSQSTTSSTKPKSKKLLVAAVKTKLGSVENTSKGKKTCKITSKPNVKTRSKIAEEAAGQGSSKNTLEDDVDKQKPSNSSRSSGKKVVKDQTKLDIPKKTMSTRVLRTRK